MGWASELRAAPVYVLSLPRRADRRAAFEQRNAAVMEHGWTWVDGVDGAALDLDAEPLALTLRHRMAVGQRVMHYEAVTPGAVGCFQGWMRVLREFVASGAPLAFLLEDDAVLPADLWSRMEGLAPPPRRWDALFVGALEQNKGLGTAHVGGWRTMAGLLAAQSYFVTRRGAQTILEHAYPIDAQYDGYLGMLARLGMLTAVRHPSLRSGQRGFRSDIQTDVCPLCHLTDGIVLKVPHLQATAAFNSGGLLLAALALAALVLVLRKRWRR
jgi:GR25 family glycosyltransferase involved in LPS biosynthesis